jgi:cyclic pyranopterin phosphate synthase
MSSSSSSRTRSLPRRRAAPALTHVGEDGASRMVDVSGKPVTRRTAVARGRIVVAASAMRLARQGRLAKGAVAEVARLAGVLAAKRTADAIPLCHPLALDHVTVELTPRRDGFEIEATVVTTGRTGAEMEALHAVTVAGLTVYDMMKAADRGMVLTDVRLVKKTGGVRGDYEAPSASRQRR